MCIVATHHVVISSAIMISSFTTKAVKLMETMFKNSFSNKIKLMSMIAPPW